MRGELFRFALAGVAVTLTAGCASLTVTYHSDPEGATLYANENQARFGYTPLTLRYKPSADFLQGRTCDTVQGAMVRWSSGAEASVPSLELCPQNGRHQQFTFVRPNVAGRTEDVAFGLELRRQTLAAQ